MYKSIIALTFVSLSMFLPLVEAATPDDTTPAEEAICDGLMADGVTKGLYGLCVAFCEAQDIADENVAITENELLALVDSGRAPSGKILNKYNTKKSENDPPMPCIVVEPPCPCFTYEELSSIDGYSPTGALLIDDVVNYQGGYIEHREWIDRATAHIAGTGDTGNTNQCRYVNRLLTPPISRIADTQSGTLTEEQFASCDAMLRESITNHGH